MPLTRREALSLFPETILRAVVEDDRFREVLGLKLDGMIVFDGDKARFDRATFFDAIRELYRSGDPSAIVKDDDGSEWSIEPGEDGGRKILRVRNAQASFQLHGFVALHHDAKSRLDEFDAALDFAGLGPDALAEWRERLTERPLRDEELRHLDAVLDHTPLEMGRKIEQQFSGPSGKTETLVPADRDYYENLIGKGVTASVPHLAAEVLAPHINRQLALHDPAVTRLTLLLASHSSILAASDIATLAESELVALLEWAASSGDLLSCIGAIETGLAALPRIPSLERTILELVTSIRDLDTTDVEGRLHFLMGILLYVGGDISRTGVLDDLPPFQRRLAIFAQAGLFERHAYGHVGVEHFTKWAIGQRGRRFYYQTLSELREEPRWVADYCTPDQLKAEFLGRISNAASTYRDNVQAGPLHDLLFGDGETDLPGSMIFPGSFLPGPLEGHTDGETSTMPAEWDAILAEALAPQDFSARSVTALINLRGLFSIGDDRVQRAVELMRSAGHRFDGDVDQDMRENIFTGLAGVASTSRNTALAAELRVMVRKNRIDSAHPPKAQREFLIAIAAAAAHAEFDAWSAYLGKWADELAFSVLDKQDADHLLADMELLSIIEPRLRRYLGNAMAALQAWLAT